MNFLFITNATEIAQYVVNNGVNQVFVDLEINGKMERQGHLNTVISKHTIDDVRRIRGVLPKGALLVRINPIHRDSAREIEEVIQSGADTLMLPMFKQVDEVVTFTRLVAGRAKCCLLVETIAATQNFAEWLKVPGVDQVHIGLNDLHLELGLQFMFQPLAIGMLDGMCAQLRTSGIPFGVGGLARMGEGILSAEILMAEHVRLGSTWAILSRTFHRQAKSVQEIVAQMDFKEELHKLRKKYIEFHNADRLTLQQMHLQLQNSVEQIVENIHTRKTSPIIQ